ncbi:MAG: ComEC/Rec2 family competence protein [Acidobacteriaceae bacterium]
MLSTPAAPSREFGAHIPDAKDVAPLRPTRHCLRVQSLKFRIVPVLLCMLCFAGGVLLAHWVWQPLAVALLAVALNALLVVAALRWSLRLALLPLAALWISLGMLCAEIQPAPAQQQQLRAYADGLNRDVIGRVVRSSPLPAEDSYGRREALLSVDLAVERVEDIHPELDLMAPVQGGVRLTLYAPNAAALPDLRCGEAVEVPVQLRLPERYLDAGAWDYASYLLEHGIGAHGTVAASKLRVLDAPQRRTLSCVLHAAQSWAGGRLTQYAQSQANLRLPHRLRISALDAGMLSAMLFGDRTQLNRRLRAGFERTGSFHLFVVSGLHLALLAGLIFLMMRRLRVPQLPATLLTLLLATAYALLTGFGLPVQRALWMTAVFLISRLLSRDQNPLNALGIAALGLLVLRPSDLFSASLQMTFLAILAIAGVAIPLGERSFIPYARATHLLPVLDLDPTLPPQVAEFRVTLRLIGEHCEPLLGRMGRLMPALLVRWFFWLCELLLVSCVAELFMVLPMAVYFHRVTALAVPTNLLVIPFIGLLMPAVLVMFACSLVHPWVALLPGAATAGLLHGITWIVSSFSRLYGSNLRMPAPEWPVLLVVLFCWAFAVWAVRRQRLLAVAGVVSLLAASVLVLWPEPPQLHPGVMEVTAIDVGQGDSLLVVTPDGHTLLVDAGGQLGSFFASHASFDVGEAVVSNYLWSRHIRRLDAVALTHAHSDHMGGMPAVLRNFRPRELWVGTNPDVPSYANLLATARSLGIRVRHFHAGEKFAFGETHVEVLAPEASYVPGKAPANNDSLVLDVDYGQSSALLEGDAEAASEHAMLQMGLVQHATLLKVGHHGSKTSSIPAFLSAASPKYAVISAGRHNPFGHPTPMVVDAFASDHVRLYRTDMLGASSFMLARDGTVHTQTYASH